MYTFFAVDGYIVTSNKSINAVFNKFEYRCEEEELFKELKREFFPEISACLALANTLNCTYRVFVWPENFPENYSVDANKIISIEPELIDGAINLSKIKRINLKSLEKGIGMLRGFSFSRVKPLLSATSNVECYLANNTPNPWPGDIDGVIYSHNDSKIKALIEFKTHNIDTPIENEYIGKYSQEDWRRFDVLFSLQDKLEQIQNHRPKILFVVWGTQDYDNHKIIKMDIVERKRVINTTYITRPPFDRPATEFTDYLLKIIS